MGLINGSSLYITGKNLQARIEGLAKDARDAKAQAQGLGKDYQFTNEVTMASQIIIDAAAKANAYLNKVKLR